MYTQEDFWAWSAAHYAASEAFYDSVVPLLETLCALSMAGLVVALGAGFYYLFWKRRR